MNSFETRVIFRPSDSRLSFLPEGPVRLPSGLVSWVNIQESPESKSGSLNFLDLNAEQNASLPLTGRPGFAFPTNQPDRFVIGMERHISIFDKKTNQYTVISDEVDSEVSGTIINDGTLIDGGIIFGCKELTFTEKKAGLWLYRTVTRDLVRLRDDQICSNGKVVCRQEGDSVEFLDIDTPTKSVVRYQLNVATGEMGPAEMAVDLSEDESFPDGMIGTPDGKSVIIAMFNPESAAYGLAKQFNLSNGQTEAVWKLDGSPQVTCPQLVDIEGQVKLLLTTAAENMSAEKVAAHPQAGCLFVGETDFDQLPATPVFEIAS